MNLSLLQNNLFYFSTKVGKNYSTEITLFQKGGSPFKLSTWIEISREIDHSPQFCFRFELFCWTLVEYSFHNVNHADSIGVNEMYNCQKCQDTGLITAGCGDHSTCECVNSMSSLIEKLRLEIKDLKEENKRLLERIEDRDANFL